MDNSRDLEELRAIPITTILGMQGISRKVSIRCPMPNHNDSSPSFLLCPDNSFHCFGCGLNGQNAVDFALYINGATNHRDVRPDQFKKALEDLKDYL